MNERYTLTREERQEQAKRPLWRRVANEWRYQWATCRFWLRWDITHDHWLSPKHRKDPKLELRELQAMVDAVQREILYEELRALGYLIPRKHTPVKAA